MQELALSKLSTLLPEGVLPLTRKEGREEGGRGKRSGREEERREAGRGRNLCPSIYDH